MPRSHPFGRTKPARYSCIIGSIFEQLECRTVPTAFTASGLVNWTDSAGGLHGVPLATVEIVEDDDGVIGTVTTDTAGRYSVNIDHNDGPGQGDPDVFVRVLARSEFSDIRPLDKASTTYSIQSATTNEVPEGKALTIDLTAGNKAINETAFGVHHSLVFIGEYARSLGGANLASIVTRFDAASTGTFYTAEDRELTVMETDRFDWDVIHHEYGHYVMNSNNFENNPGGDHSSLDNLGTTRGDKEVGLTLAWGEAWPTFFGISGQQVMNAAALNIPRVGDAFYDDTEDDNSRDDLETGLNLGEDNEASILRTLWDLFDSSNDGGDDVVSMSDVAIFNALRDQTPEIDTAGKAWEKFASIEDTAGKLRLAAIFAKNNIAPALTGPADGLRITTTPPQFTWLKNGAGVGLPLNDFRITFYKNDLSSQVFQKNLGDTDRFTPSAAEWETIRTADGAIQWVIEGRSTTLPATPGGALGYYWSGARSFSGGLLTVSPATAGAGTMATVTVTGLNTNFVNGSTTASFGNGVEVLAVRVQSPTRAEVDVRVANDAAAGTRTVTLSTAGVAENRFGGFQVTAVAQNVNPVAVDDNTTIHAGSAGIIIPVLANDSDGDGDPITIATVTQPSNGTVAINAAGNSLTFQPAANFVGSDRFTYSITDGKGGNATAVVNVVVSNMPPVATDDAATLNGTNPIILRVLDNDRDADNDPLTIAAVTNPTNGTATINTGGTITYTPSTGFVGNDTFTYTVSDGFGGLSTATVRVAVTGRSQTLNGVSQSRTAFSAVTDGAGRVLVLAPDGSVLTTVTPFDTSSSGLRIAVYGDSSPMLVVGTGPGVATQVRLIDGSTGDTARTINPFEATFLGGVFVAAGDINGDGIADLAVSAAEGGGPRVRIYDGATGNPIADFFGIEDPTFRGGARIALADLNGDGVADLLVAAGTGGGPRVAIWNGVQLALGNTSGDTAKLTPDFFVFEPTLRGGVFIAGGDINGDGFDDLIAGGGPRGGPRVLALSGANLSTGGIQTTLVNFLAGDPDGRGGVRVAVKQLDADNQAEILTGSGDGLSPRLDVYLGSSFEPSGTPQLLRGLDIPDGDAVGGVFVG